jgi:hypothetical protein
LCLAVEIEDGVELAIARCLEQGSRTVDPLGLAVGDRRILVAGPLWPSSHLGTPYRGEADYWAGHLGLALDVDDVQVVASLLEDVAGSPWLPEPMQHWARAWVATITELLGGPQALSVKHGRGGVSNACLAWVTITGGFLGCSLGVHPVATREWAHG